MTKREDQQLKFNRRDALRLAALAGGGIFFGRTLAACAEPSAPDALIGELDGQGSPLFVGGLTTSLRDELHYEAKVYGRLPRALRGALYKNGPGLFERGNIRKRTLLDGDGMITAYRFQDGKVEFQNRYVRTSKWEAEEAAGRYLQDSWTTAVNNPPVQGGDQAGVTVWPWADRLYAFDEGNPPWELAPADLSTVRQATFGLERNDAAVFAHGKQLADQFSLFGVNYANLNYNYLVIDSAHRVVDQRHFPVTDFGPPGYVHDWFVTPHYFVVHAMPALIDGEAMAKGSVVRDAMRWHPEMPSRLLVFRRDQPGAPRIFEMEPAWMWHTANAFERGSELVLDWVGYDDPYHFVGNGAEWETIMQGVISPTGATGVLRRTVLDLNSGSSRTQRYDELYDQEFPVISQNKAGMPYRYTYLVHGAESGVLYQAVAKLDLESGRSDVFDFGPGRIPLEPTFVPRPDGRHEDDGWVLVEVANADTGKTELSVLDARRIADGPIAIVQLNQHIPMRFHGRWAPG